MTAILSAPAAGLAIRLGDRTDERYAQTVRTPQHSKRSAGRGKLLVAAFAVLLAGLCASGGALAERGERRGGGMVFDRFAFPGGARDNAEREAMREDQRRQRRMSEEQRQQLRRDIDEAGRDIYRRPRRFPAP